MAQAKDGDYVRVQFVGKTENGEVFATSQGHGPLEFSVGDGTVLPGLDKAITGMSQGEHKTVTIAPTDGFGEPNASLILVVDRSHFPEGFEPKEGMELQVPQPNGVPVFLKILQILDDNKVKLDANHPLAGKTLTFELELLEIAPIPT